LFSDHSRTLFIRPIGTYTTYRFHMKLARYIGNGEIAIVEEEPPSLPKGGLLVKTEASGLCSGELMDWYMDRKIPHVLGHEVAGKVIESDDERFPVGGRVFAHHHAPCMKCEMCKRGLYVHCEQWKKTKLTPGGMSEYFAVAKENLNDTILVDDMRAIDAALIEPLACVAKSIRRALTSSFSLQPIEWEPRAIEWQPAAVIGLGVMGLMHMLVLSSFGPHVIGYDLNVERVIWAKTIGLAAQTTSSPERANLIIVCPGNQAALDMAASMINPGGTIVLFAPLPPDAPATIDLNQLYFRDARLVSSYSCGPRDTRLAATWLRQGKIKAEQVVSDFIPIDELPQAYQAMKKGDILKAMVIFE